MIWRKGIKLGWLEAFFGERFAWWVTYGLVGLVELPILAVAVMKGEFFDALPALGGLPLLLLLVHATHAAWEALTPAVGVGAADRIAVRGKTLHLDVRRKAKLLKSLEAEQVARGAEKLYRSLIKDLVEHEKGRRKRGELMVPLPERFNAKIALLEQADDELGRLLEERSQREQKRNMRPDESFDEEQKDLEASLTILREIRAIEKRSWEEIEAAAGLRGSW